MGLQMCLVNENGRNTSAVSNSEIGGGNSAEIIKNKLKKNDDGCICTDHVYMDFFPFQRFSIHSWLHPWMQNLWIQRANCI